MRFFAVLISVIFSVITYWLSNFNPTAVGFFTWVMWLFLDLLAAESLVVFMAGLFPSFVISSASPRVPRQSTCAASTCCHSFDYKCE